MNIVSFNFLGALDFFVAFSILCASAFVVARYKNFKVSPSYFVGVLSAIMYFIFHGLAIKANSIELSQMFAKIAVYFEIISPISFIFYLFRFIKNRDYKDYLFLFVSLSLAFVLVLLNSFSMAIIDSPAREGLGFQPVFAYYFSIPFLAYTPGCFVYLLFRFYRQGILEKKWVGYFLIVAHIVLLHSLVVAIFHLPLASWIIALFTVALVVVFIINIKPKVLESVSGTEILDFLPCPVLFTDKDNKVIYLNQATKSLVGSKGFGESIDAVKGLPRSLPSLIAGQTRRVKIFNQYGEAFSYVAHKISFHKKSFFYIFYRGDYDENLMLDINRLIASNKSYIAEMNKFKEREKLLKESNDMYSIAAQSNDAGTWDWNLSSCSVNYSKKFKELLGYRNFEFSQSPKEWLSRIDEADTVLFVDQISALIKGKIKKISIEQRIQRKDGSFFWALIEGLAIKDSKGSVFRLIGSIKDITVRKNSEKELAYELRHDINTGLPNSLYLKEELSKLFNQTIDRGRYAVLLLDVDRFKSINESLGYHKGDLILKKIGKRISDILDDKGLLFKMGGDEYIVLLKDISSVLDATVFANKIQDQLRKKIKLEEHRVLLTVSIGIAVAKDSDEEPVRILSEAQIALTQAKESGKANYRIFDDDLNKTAMKIITMEKDLKEAIKGGDFDLAYQPIVNLNTNSILGMEALIRWKHKKKGFISPEYFIPFAEDTDLIIPIGDWVLKKACAKVSELYRKSLVSDGFHLAINISGKQLKDPDFAQKVISAVNGAKLSPSSVILEITERSILHDFDKVKKVLVQLSDFGIKFHLDDFGEGYTSLKLLRDLPIDTMKIDKSYVTGLKAESSQSLILKSIIDLGHNMGKKVIAEGIEELTDVEALLGFNCEMGQGYYFYRPIDDKDVENFINTNMLETIGT
ncbi:MAG: EAL domain-containing protein [Spirochaetales bacterium]|nr:EAL domain-containing protein [Spirochaetales bacterium]